MENLDKQLAKAIELATKGVSDGVGFLGRELPDVIEQLLTYYTVWYWVSFVLISLVTGFFAFLIVKVWQKYNIDERFVMLIPLTIAFFISFFIWWVRLSYALKITLAPKIWLIEYSATLIKNLAN